ncbi:interleukin-15 isoform X1 [Erinaceus europaeus]|uniref:Interleukin n=1 Tax=Erinaceus europaeus TaxID=9365 RepID=A0A1S3WHL9_ERIEU|nr:interleukin-15 isoform X1 [Erinaceus europaeus]XP_060035024.1 interleukin-15 isoform X1 [Erinaceus europaeus]XP_060035025.1 interleukin-15 isoform X1 [Erinaceus europaeus]
MRISKSYLRSTSIQCYLCLLLNSHFLTEAGIHVFILGCISAGLPKTEANWSDVMADIEKIKHFIQHVHIDATLYTESDIDPNCQVTAMKCFLLELHVISQEARDGNFTLTIENLLILANSSLSAKQVLATCEDGRFRFSKPHHTLRLGFMGYAEKGVGWGAWQCCGTREGEGSQLPCHSFLWHQRSGCPVQPTKLF